DRHPGPAAGAARRARGGRGKGGAAAGGRRPCRPSAPRGRWPASPGRRVVVGRRVRPPRGRACPAPRRTAPPPRRPAPRPPPPLACEIHMDDRRSALFHRRRPVAPADAVIPRIAPSIANYGLAVVNQFALAGACVLNTADAIALSRNKMRSLQLLSSHGIAIP